MHDTRDSGSIPGLRRLPGVGNGDLFQYFLPRKFWAWRATVYGATESDMTEHTLIVSMRYALVLTGRISPNNTNSSGFHYAHSYHNTWKCADTMEIIYTCGIQPKDYRNYHFEKKISTNIEVDLNFARTFCQPVRHPDNIIWIKSWRIRVIWYQESDWTDLMLNHKQKQLLQP